MSLEITKKLDYKLYTNGERAEQVRELFTEEVTNKAKLNFESSTTQRELETAANFILYGKDPANDKNFVQKKEVQIDSRKATYKRKEPESLDGLLEDPNTKETDFMPVQKNVYKKVKPTIDRDLDKDIPGMKDLWEAIDVLAAQVKQLKEDKNLGLEYYKKNHYLIELRKEQFALKDSESETMRGHTFGHCQTPPICFTSDTGYIKDELEELKYKKFRTDHYRSRYGEEWYAAEVEKIEKELGWYNYGILMRDGRDLEEYGWEWVEVSDNLIDFTDREHIYQLIENYGSLVQYCDENVECDLKYVLWELERYIEEADLGPDRKHILIRKIDKYTNDQIRDELREEFGLCYSDNYISTIYKQQICDKIAQAAKLSFDTWNLREQDEKFKVCSTCNTRLLRDPRNFIKKQTARDGLAARCKKCDKKVREKKKQEDNK